MLLPYTEILELSRFLPFMSAVERRDYELCLLGVQLCVFNEARLAVWASLLNARNERIQERFDAAIAESLVITKL